MFLDNEGTPYHGEKEDRSILHSPRPVVGA